VNDEAIIKNKNVSRPCMDSVVTFEDNDRLGSFYNLKNLRSMILSKSHQRTSVLVDVSFTVSDLTLPRNAELILVGIHSHRGFISHDFWKCKSFLKEKMLSLELIFQYPAAKTTENTSSTAVPKLGTTSTTGTSLRLQNWYLT
jgi:hypothetical protein